ncbi:hypothetical protein [Psychroserpens sp.]
MTKSFICILIVLFTVNVSSQSTTIKLDYTVSYEIQSKKNVKDTLKISFDKEGKYFYSDTEILAKDLAKTIFKRKQHLINNSKIHLIFDVDKELAYISFNSGQNAMFFQMDITDFMPKGGMKHDSIAPEKIQFISKRTDKKVSVLNSEYNLYKMYPSHEVEKPIYVAFDESYDFNINNILYLFASKFALAENNFLERTDINKGIIMQVKNHKDTTILKAVNITTQQKTIKFNHSFTID